MKKILVTGATGFIGKYVVQELLKFDFSIIASSANPKQAEKVSWFSKVEYIPLDFHTLDTGVNYFQFFNEPDILIHLAWEGLPNYKSSFHTEVNLPRHKLFLSNLIQNGLNDLSVTGTCFEYGMQEGSLREDLPAIPSNPYSVAKDELRKSLEALQKKYSFSMKWIRLFYVYGTGQNPNSLFSQLDKALEKDEKIFNMSGGEQVRDYLPVEKMAEYIIRIALQKKVTGIINCCSGKPVVLKDMVKEYLKNKNKNININFGYYPYADYEPKKFWGDASKMNKIINRI